MPYAVRREANAYAVVKPGTSKVYGRHKTRAAAMRQLRALYANEGMTVRRKRKGKK